ncbi:PREDICTED: uncharacterized protein LOC109592591 [Amphimedon queenslandica]|uniref:Uncharacterized protein n=1 Tax=Amphimedon queenslandica TaxID=400682 RepID=A0A1X7SKM8_AMPQE|nr:PREDICTED: uncharacterized protein LOC109592591 [Amphimedon queenslandica]|eukprot:XP_019863564.1 PREDICTED: uncharacterized protein LOC109592591 [Amphimedon queenslandica]
MQETDCGGSDFKKCVKDCASCDDNIDSCDYILSVTCQHDIGTSKPANKMGVCTPKGISMMNSGQVAVAALVLILFLYVYFITRVCIRIISICCRRRRGQPLLEGNVNNENNNNNNNKCRRIICDILCCN